MGRGNNEGVILREGERDEEEKTAEGWCEQRRGERMERRGEEKRERVDENEKHWFSHSLFNSRDKMRYFVVGKLAVKM